MRSEIRALAYSAWPLNNVNAQTRVRKAGGSHGTKLVALKRRRETGCSVTNHSANREKLQWNPSIQQRRPLNTHFHSCTHADFVLRDGVRRNHQDAATAQVNGTTLSREKRSGKRAEANAQVQWKAELQPAFRWNGPTGKYGASIPARHKLTPPSRTESA
jgi:hypothetical protein